MAAAQMFTGKIKKILPTKTFSSGSSSRQFWCEEMNGSAFKSKYPNVLSFEVFTSSKGPSDRYAGVADLDSLKPGQIVRFSWEPKGNVWNNPKTGTESCFVKLSVVTKIDLLGNGKQHGDVPAPAEPSADVDDGDDDDSPMPF